MQKTIHFALFLFLVTGMLFAGCKEVPKEDDVVNDVGGSLEESLGVEAGTLDDESGSTSNSGSTSTSDCANVDPSLAAALGCDTSATTESSMYKDGTYSENATYNSPAGVDTMGVTLTLKDGVITGVSIENLATNEASIQFQNLFADGISSVVVGKPIASLGAIGAVNGASLTPAGFNAAVEAIMADAQA